MERCASVRKKGSTEQCPLHPVYGHTLCGRHARSSRPVLWAEVHRTGQSGLAKAQALIRGYLLRTRLRRGGPGVICRRDLANDEDFYTMNTASEVSPFDYVGFDEAGKRWWFEFATLFAWCVRSTTPVNPYTNVPLSAETRKRLFHLWSYRVRHRLPLILLLHVDEVQNTANYLSQIFNDHGFVDVRPHDFTDKSKDEWVRFFRLVQNDLISLHSETSLVRRRGIMICRRMENFSHMTTVRQYACVAQHNLLRLLTIPRDPYLTCFMVLSCSSRC